MLVLRTCDALGRSREGRFQHPTVVGEYVEAPDWHSRAECGGGIHGALWGEGDGSLLSWAEDALWMVYEVNPAEGLVEIDHDKCKFRRGHLVFCGNKLGATSFLVAHGAEGRAIIGSTLTGGDRSTLTGGDRSTLTGGYGSTLTGGYGSTLTGGDRSTLTGGYGSTLTGGDRSTLTGGYGSTLTFKVWDSSAARWRHLIAYPGEDGIKVATPYRVIDGKVVEVAP